MLHALSIRQPWLDMMVRNQKTMEIRDWPAKRRGMIALHASTSVDYSAAYFYGYKEPWTLNRGVVVAVASIREVVELDRETWERSIEFHRQPIPCEGGAYGLVLENLKVLRRPVRCRGRLFFFPLDESTSNRVQELLP
jgi:hypothetical protein